MVGMATKATLAVVRRKCERAMTDAFRRTLDDLLHAGTIDYREHQALWAAHVKIRVPA